MIILTALMLAAAPAHHGKAPAKARPAATRVATVAPSEDWLRGLWVSDQDKGDQMEGCAAFTALFFQSDGHYLHGEAMGEWAVRNGQLVQQPTAYAEGGGDEEKAGEPVASKLVRLSEDRMRIVPALGPSTLYLRCPKPETPVAR